MSTGKTKLTVLEPVRPVRGFQKDYELRDRIGRGAYGHVYKALHKESGEMRAVKSREVVSVSAAEEAAKEISLMQHSSEADGKEIMIRYFANYLEKRRGTTRVWMVMEWCEFGSLHDVMALRGKKPFSEREIARICRDVVTGLAFLHKSHKIHRDIKSDNILLKRDGSLRIADFGISGSTGSTMGKRSTMIGTPYFLAPEVILAEDYDNRVDVWSLGITIYELREGAPPYFTLPPMKVLFLIPSADPPTFTDPDKVSSDLVDFLSKCLEKDPADRATAAELATHSLCTGSDPESLTELVTELVSIKGEPADKATEKSTSPDRSDAVLAESDGAGKMEAPALEETQNGASTSEEGKEKKDSSSSSPSQLTPEEILLLDQLDEVYEAVEGVVTLRDTRKRKGQTLQLQDLLKSRNSKNDARAEKPISRGKRVAGKTDAREGDDSSAARSKDKENEASPESSASVRANDDTTGPSKQAKNEPISVKVLRGSDVETVELRLPISREALNTATRLNRKRCVLQILDENDQFVPLNPENPRLWVHAYCVLRVFDKKRDRRRRKRAATALAAVVALRDDKGGEALKESSARPSSREKKHRRSESKSGKKKSSTSAEESKRASKSTSSSSKSTGASDDTTSKRRKKSRRS